MPTYRYKCKSCGNEFEKFQPITAGKVKKCPNCGGRVERLIGTGAAILFKGSGFYATDYRKSPKNGRKGSKDEGNKNTGNGKEEKKDSVRKEER